MQANLQTILQNCQNPGTNCISMMYYMRSMRKIWLFFVVDLPTRQAAEQALAQMEAQNLVSSLVLKVRG